MAATVTGESEEGARFEEKTTVRDLSLQGAYLWLRHRPALQSEVNVVIEAGAGQNASRTRMLRGMVVHRERAPENDQNGVGIVFIQDSDPGRPRD